MMKKYALLAALLVSSGSFASVSGQPPLADINGQCEPGFCLSSVKAGNEMVQGMRGLARQVRHVLEPASAEAVTDITD